MLMHEVRGRSACRRVMPIEVRILKKLIACRLASVTRDILRSKGSVDDTVAKPMGAVSGFTNGDLHPSTVVKAALRDISTLGLP